MNSHNQSIRAPTIKYLKRLPEPSQMTFGMHRAVPVDVDDFDNGGTDLGSVSYSNIRVTIDIEDKGGLRQLPVLGAAEQS
jgi:hypothetical protein